MIKNICLLLITTYSFVGFAQRKVLVPEGFGTLNEIIRKDTLAGGIRKDPNTVYVLRRGGVYSLSGTILTSGFHLRLVSEEGNGPRPFLRMGFLEGATQVEEVFEVRGDVTFRGIHLTIVNEFNTFIARGISSSAPNLKLRFYDCLIDGSGQTFLRLNSGGTSVFMLNCTVSRMGRPSNPDNGRVIDDRGNDMDSIVVENNTWYNVTSRMIRDGGGIVNYIRMNQNTLVSGGQRFSSFGPVNQLIVTNNVIVNPRFIGNSSTSTLVSTDFSLAGENPLVNFNNNNIYFDQAIYNVWDEIIQSGGTRIQPPFVTPENQPLIDNATGIIHEQLVFSNGPAAPTTFVRELELGAGSSIQDWDWTGAFNGNPWELTDLAYHNFSYPQTSNSFTGSSTGEPLGDLRWFPSYDVAWTLHDLIKQAEQLILREQDNPVIGGDATSLSTLESELLNAKLVTEAGSSTGIDFAAARDALLQAMESFSASLVITQSQAEEVIKLFPNPTNDFIWISAPPGRIDVVVYSINGQRISEAQSNSGELRLSLQENLAGLYLIKVRTEYGVVIKKIKKL